MRIFVHLYLSIYNWALEPTGWIISGSTNIQKYDITDINEEEHFNTIFYKERLIEKGNYEENLIITYSIKYRNYHQRIRSEQIMRAEKAISSGSIKRDRKNQHDFRRFVSNTSVTKDGEIAEKKIYSIDESRIAEEARYDGYYAVATNLDDDPSEIIRVNKHRWQIEECFRIMKHEFKARPVYLKNDELIKAHFTTCYIALMLYRFLEKKTSHNHICTELTDTLRNMNFLKIEGSGYIPTYTRTEITDSLHNAFGFRTDYEIVTDKHSKKF